MSPNSSTIRCFVALVPATTTRVLLASLLEQLQPEPLDPARYRPVALDQLHVTLAFFKELDSSRVCGLSELLKSVTVGQPRIVSHATELLALPSSRQPQVLALRLTDAGDYMQKLAQALRLALDPADRLRFLPHMTLGRARRGKAWQSFRPIPISSAQFGFERVVLYRSLLEPTGSRYVELARAELLSGEP